MASGKNHDRACYASSLVFLSLAVGLRQVEGIYWAAGALLGLFVSPDLDMPNTNPRNRWRALRVGPIHLGWVWHRYEKALKHRSWWSHTPIVGTVGRVIYCLPLWPVWLLLRSYSLPIWAGLAMVDTLHWVMDDFNRRKRHG